MDRVPLIFERSRTGRVGVSLPPCDVDEVDLSETLPPELLRDDAPLLPEVSELDVVRHYTELSHLNYGVDTGFYPLGSCTMKYNPKVNDWAAGLSGFEQLHPLQPDHTVQGVLEALKDLERWLLEITGMDAMSLQPAAGAQGEFTGILVILAYLKNRGQDQRTVILVPDSAHGTNPATASMAGCTVKVVPSNQRGQVDVDALRALVDENVAGLMLTNPNTLGIFESDILEIAEIVHQAGGLLYYDGANANAILGKVRPGDMGFDVVHLNLHKTFSTPHGGGGPGSGPVGVKSWLEPYLPTPWIKSQADGSLIWADRGPRSIGKVRSYYGNVGVLLRAYAYLLTQGADGLTEVAETAVLNANYLASLLRQHYDMPYPESVKHEFVLSLTKQKERGSRSFDVAKRLIDYGFYPPTVYFPLVVAEAMMVEPTETESKETLERFSDAMIQIDKEVDHHPELLASAPQTTVVSRLDETLAARRPELVYRPSNEPE